MSFLLWNYIVKFFGEDSRTLAVQNGRWQSLYLLIKQLEEMV